MLPMEKSVIFTGACANEIMAEWITRSFVNKAKEGGLLEFFINTAIEVSLGWCGFFDENIML